MEFGKPNASAVSFIANGCVCLCRVYMCVNEGTRWEARAREFIKNFLIWCVRRVVVVVIVIIVVVTHLHTLHVCVCACAIINHIPQKMRCARHIALAVRHSCVGCWCCCCCCGCCRCSLLPADGWELCTFSSHFLRWKTFKLKIYVHKRPSNELSNGTRNSSNDTVRYCKPITKWHFVKQLAHARDLVNLENVLHHCILHPR